MMDIQNKISDERLSFYATTQPPFGYTGSDINRMARELVSLRAQLAELAKQEPDFYAVYGSKGKLHSHCGSIHLARSLAKIIGGTFEGIFTRAAPPAQLVVKLPKKRRIAYYPGHSLKAVYREEYNALEIIEAIKAAGGSVEDE